MPSKKQVETGDSQTYEEAIQEIADATKLLVEAGMAGAAAGELAFKVWYAGKSTVHPAATTHSE